MENACTLKSFEDVFSKLKLSANVISVLKKTNVNNVKMSKHTKVMDIGLVCNNILNESCIGDFKEDIKFNFPFISDVNINIFYDVESSFEEKIDKYWVNILNVVKSKSPICYNILKKAKVDIEENTVIINVDCKSAFLFRAKDIDGEIKRAFKNRFNMIINVIFKNNPIKIKTDDEKKKELEVFTNKAIIASIDLGKIAEQSKEKANSTTIAEKKSVEIKVPFEGNSRDLSSGYENGSSFADKSKFRKKKVKVKFSKFNDDITKIRGSIIENETVAISGKILSFEERETKKGNIIISIDMTDLTDSVTVKFFLKPEEYTDEVKNILKPKKYIKVKGKAEYDTYTKEVDVMASNICEANPPKPKMDNAPEKRVELHLHTNMSMMDGINPAKDYIERASVWGHKAIAITDHGVVQAYPEAMDASKKFGVKVLYGVEAYIVDDLGAVVQAGKGQSLDDEYVVFDLETTGLNKETDKIIEIGAVKVKNGKIVDKFSAFVNPKVKLTEKIIELTNITDDMLENEPTEDVIMPKFLEFFGDSVLVAHNANFDVGFVRQWAKQNDIEITNTVIDTVELSKVLFPELSRYKLDIVAKHLGISLENHHRAVDDAYCTAEIFVKCIEYLREKDVSNVEQINILASENIDVKKLKTYHAVILVKNQKGLRNLYELISKAHIEYFFRRPRIPKSEYLKFKEGLIIGTACEAGEFYKAVFENKPDDVIKGLIDFYDYLEIQPIGNNDFMIRENKVKSEEELKNVNKRIVELGEKYNKLVVATCDAHFLDPEDEFFRRIIQTGEGFKDVDNQPPLYYRTTEEMLKEFDYLGEEKAYEIVVTNTNLIADMIEDVKPIPDETYAPKIDGAEEQLTEITMNKAKSIYGAELPEIVAKRLDRELNSIISNGFAVLYIIAQKLVWDSNDHGYIVGSRGSVGSSFVATMAGITEVNPLEPHYICENCKYSDFDSEEVRANAGNSGFDLPDKNCPICGKPLKKNGQAIPFETFLGFNGDKEPDIDLNFSGEYQQQAHAYTEELFGTGHVFKAGTIGTTAEKTAFGYVKKYADERNLTMSNAEVNRLKLGCVGVKRTTGQHPGGLMVVPRDNSIYEFCPIQRPANDQTSTVTTTHFDYHSISGRLLKLDLLGHDVPTILRMFYDITGVDPLEVPLDDKETMSLFTSPKALNVTEEDINCKTGTFGIPEFGTAFTRQMLMDTQPHTFSELVRISGISHGTDVWVGNAQDLIKSGTATLKEVIATRDDIMLYLISKGVENKTAFTIMEKVRKGKGLTEEHEAAMREANVPDWYIDSCKKIKYMFPKGHAVAYVTNSFRIAYFKVHYPCAFYAATFSVKAEDFDYVVMCNGDEEVKNRLNELYSLGNDISTKEKSTLAVLELVHEMYQRGFKFVPMNLYKSDAIKFKVTDDGFILPPLCTIQGLGANAAENIVNERENGEFSTIEEFRERTKVSKTVIQLLKDSGIFEGIPDTNQMSLF